MVKMILDKKGVSPLVAMVLVVAISIAGITLVLQVGGPTLDKGREAVIISEAKGVLTNIDRAIREVASEGTGAARKVAVKTSGGRYTIDATLDEVRFELDSSGDVIPAGIAQKEGNILITSGADVKAYEADVNADGATDLVLENSRILFAVNKSGSAAAKVNWNTRHTVKLIQIKETGTNVTPTDSSIYIDGNTTSALGSGYSTLVEKGENLGKGEIVLSIDSAIVTYEIRFTLLAGSDFVIVRAQNVKYKP